MSTPITAGMPLSVQNPTVKGGFKPTVMSRSRVVNNQVVVFRILPNEFSCAVSTFEATRHSNGIATYFGMLFLLPPPL